MRKGYLCCTRPTTKAKKMGFSKYLALKSEINDQLTLACLITVLQDVSVAHHCIPCTAEVEGDRCCNEDECTQLTVCIPTAAK